MDSPREYNQTHSASGGAQKVKEQVMDTGVHVVDEQKNSAAREVGKIGAALHSAARSLRDSNSSIADWAENSASMADKASRQLAQSDVREVMRTAEDYARKYPGWTIAGMFFGGVALSRFFKSST